VFTTKDGSPWWLASTGPSCRGTVNTNCYLHLTSDSHHRGGGSVMIDTSCAAVSTYLCQRFEAVKCRLVRGESNSGKVAVGGATAYSPAQPLQGQTCFVKPSTIYKATSESNKMVYYRAASNIWGRNSSATTAPTVVGDPNLVAPTVSDIANTASCTTDNGLCHEVSMDTFQASGKVGRVCPKYGEPTSALVCINGGREDFQIVNLTLQGDAHVELLLELVGAWTDPGATCSDQWGTNLPVTANVRQSWTGLPIMAGQP
jgi:hypothetical protein